MWNKSFFRKITLIIIIVLISVIFLIKSDVIISEKQYHFNINKGYYAVLLKFKDKNFESNLINLSGNDVIKLSDLTSTINFNKKLQYYAFKLAIIEKNNTRLNFATEVSCNIDNSVITINLLNLDNALGIKHYKHVIYINKNKGYSTIKQNINIKVKTIFGGGIFKYKIQDYIDKIAVDTLKSVKFLIES